MKSPLTNKDWVSSQDWPGIMLQVYLQVLLLHYKQFEGSDQSSMAFVGPMVVQMKSCQYISR